MACDDLWRGERKVRPGRAVVGGGQRVIVAGGDGVVLVVVAASTGHGQPQHATRKRVDAIVQLVGHDLGGDGTLVVLGAQALKAQARQLFKVVGYRLGKQIAG